MCQYHKVFVVVGAEILQALVLIQKLTIFTSHFYHFYLPSNIEFCQFGGLIVCHYQNPFLASKTVNILALDGFVKMSLIYTFVNVTYAERC